MHSPICGKYVKRSAIASGPNCTTPIASTSIPKYQSQPTRRYGCFFLASKTPTVTAVSRAKEPQIFHRGRLEIKNGYHSAKPVGQKNWRRYVAYETKALPIRQYKGRYTK